MFSVGACKLSSVPAVMAGAPNMANI